MKINLEIPVEYFEEDGQHVIVISDESYKFLDIPIVVQEDSKEKAIQEFWGIIKSHIDYLSKRSYELNRWKPFQKGNWKHIGGSWFIIFGFMVYFRRGKGMKGGWYVPFTKLNIRFINYWGKL